MAHIVITINEEEFTDGGERLMENLQEYLTQEVGQDSFTIENVRQVSDDVDAKP